MKGWTDGWTRDQKFWTPFGHLTVNNFLRKKLSRSGVILCCDERTDERTNRWTGGHSLESKGTFWLSHQRQSWCPYFFYFESIDGWGQMERTDEQSCYCPKILDAFSFGQLAIKTCFCEKKFLKLDVRLTLQNEWVNERTDGHYPSPKFWASVRQWNIDNEFRERRAWD
jgi:hypothetical protein